MLATKVACPQCSKKLKTPKPVSEGKRLRCSRCNTSFVVRLQDMLDPLPAAGAIATEAGPNTELTLPDENPADWHSAPPIAVATRAPAAIPATVPRPQTTPIPTPASQPASEERQPPEAGPAGNRLVLPIVIVVGLSLLTGVAIYLTISLGGSSGPVKQDSNQITDATRPNSPANPQSPMEEPRREPVSIHQDPVPPGGNPRQPAPPEKPAPLVTLPPEEQERVNKAIDRGVEYLRKMQLDNGTWGKGHLVGYAALPGLTLLECGLPANDPKVQKAADFVRSAVPRLGATYELSLAILFLDRLGDPKDRPLIQTMALRLLAGQSPVGGWTYNCPIISPEDEPRFLLALKETRPRTIGELFVPGPNGKRPEWVRPGTEDRPLLIGLAPETRPGEVVRGIGQPEKPPLAVQPFNPNERPAVLASLPVTLQKVPALQIPVAGKPLPGWDHSDNSNTQFAILGLWAAGRHNVPMERALALLVTRFRSSQSRDGGWGYGYQLNGNAGTPSMTGAGLLGLAVGEGLTASAGAGSDQRTFDDPAIKKGLKSIGQHIGRPLGKRGNARGRADINLYFLWTLERVAMIYGLPTIDDKDWYGWGAELLVDSQTADGNWKTGMYHGSSPVLDTSLALLFLKRANLAKDLTQQIEILNRVK